MKQIKLLLVLVALIVAMLLPGTASAQYMQGYYGCVYGDHRANASILIQHDSPYGTTYGAIAYWNGSCWFYAQGVAQGYTWYNIYGWPHCSTRWHQWLPAGQYNRVDMYCGSYW